MTGEPIRLTEEDLRRRRRRSVALGMILAALVLLIYVITYFKLGPGVMDRPL